MTASCHDVRLALTSASLGMTSSAPPIAATNSTPPKTNSSPYRLLYRGALSLPDSHLLLDGLTFVAKLETLSKNNHLLENPLALALESMRGRPSLRLMGVVQLKDDSLWLDESGGIELFVLHTFLLIYPSY